DDLGEGFVPKLSFGKFGILCVLRTFQNEKLGTKTRSNRKRGVSRGALYYYKEVCPKAQALFRK
ncbi:MAG: hypothetical protein IKC09_07775, partial [Oscillospiraceae bacterium]|nr:hypothetical protein [Oscillospiraceae bacterium]